MGFHLRKRLLQETSSPHPPLHDRCETRSDYLLPPPQPLVPLPPRDHSQYSNRLMNASLIITACIIGGALLVAIMFKIILKSYSSRNRSRRRNSLILFDTREEFLDEDHGPVIDHHIWFIQTVGLQQPVIDSITVFKYKNDEGLVDGTECSVCLSEFEEDETLRLLPKCNHAFHIPCIDTWLGSHTNCPMCRAPIIVQTPSPEADVDNSSPGEETQVGIPSSSGTGSSDREEDECACELSVGLEEEGELAVVNGGERCEISNEEVNDVQPMRRSVSLDSLSASKISLAIANTFPTAIDGNSNTQRARGNEADKRIVSRRLDRNRKSLELLGSSSKGRSLTNKTVSMKRSFSWNGKFLLFNYNQSRDSVLRSF